jgi:HTH-type transcriptional regulator / antitoxin HipB
VGRRTGKTIPMSASLRGDRCRALPRYPGIGDSRRPIRRSAPAGGALRVLRNLWLDAVGRRAGGVGVGGEVVAELAVVHHRSEDAGLVPGQPGQPVGELLVGEAAQPRLGGAPSRRLATSLRYPHMILKLQYRNRGSGLRYPHTRSVTALNGGTEDVMAEAWAAVHTPEDLGRFLARVRQDHGLTQEELAEDLGVSRRYVSEIENGKPGLYTERLFQMLRLLGVRLRAEQVG